jgi:Domain of unknown function (DUF222)
MNEGRTELEALADRIARTAASIDAATHTLLTDIRDFDGRCGWAAQGALSCAHWLSWWCGIALGAAREKVRVANALAALPLMDDELRRGQLSFSKVRAMTRVATPENEARLVELARGSTAAQLEKMCRLLDQLRPRDPATDEERRWLRARDEANGLVKIEAQLRPEEAARVLAACDAAAGEGGRRVDGLVAMAEATLRGDKPDRAPVDVMVHIDAGTLTGEAAGAGISAEIARRLLCDAGVVAVLEDAGGQPLDVGRKQRVFAGALRRALVARDKGCRFPGCTHTRYLDAHHVRHWVNGGATSAANALMLCTRHHGLVHEGGFRVIADGDGVRFLQPDGREVPPRGVPPTTRPDELPVTAEMPPTWDGDPVDYEAATAYAM